jgi:uncharacterized metal-binding protein YceD (DUF177 family)
LSPTREFSREVAIDPWPSGGVAVSVEADATERQGLARRFGLLEVEAFSGRGQVERLAGGGFRFEGWLQAQVVQACVVSLEPVRAEIHERLARRYVSERHAPQRPASWAIEAAIEAEADDEVELLTGTRIDVGEAFAEQLGLALDPYPRAADAEAVMMAALGEGVTFSPDRSDDTAAPTVAPPEAVAR